MDHNKLINFNKYFFTCVKGFISAAGPLLVTATTGITAAVSANQQGRLNDQESDIESVKASVSSLTSSVAALESSVSSSSSRNVRSSEEAQGARKPTREGNPDSKLSVASVLSPSKVKSEQGIKINGNTQHSAQRGQSGRTPFFICHDTIIYHYLFNL